MIKGWILVMIYSGLTIVTEPRADLKTCLADAAGKIGEEMPVNAWDNMNGSNPIPKVVIAFCVQGASAK